MERISQIYSGRPGVIFNLVIIFGCLSAPVYCQPPGGTSLILEQSPLQGGVTTPGAGVYSFAAGSEVILVAVPRTGYRFRYWLGDVVDSTSSSTVTYLDKPKVIIAVFEQTGYEISIPAAGASDDKYRSEYGGGGGGGPTIASRNNGPTRSGRLFFTTPKSEDTRPSVPADETPIIPEPATGILLVLGSLSLLTKHKA